MSWFNRLFGRQKATCDQRTSTSAFAAERVPQTPDTSRATQQDPERMYTEALALFKRSLFKDAARLLEEAGPLNPTSAPIYFTLAVTYSRIGGECGNDNAAALPWLRKSGATFQKAIDLANTHGGLNASQLEKARTSLQLCAPFME
jgi:tetratricopeptide (TPR) repeat protein